MRKSALILGAWMFLAGCTGGGSKVDGEHLPTEDTGSHTDNNVLEDIPSPLPEDALQDDAPTVTDVSKDDAIGDVQTVNDAAQEEDVTLIEPVNGSPGCSAPEVGATGEQQLTYTFSEKAGGERSFFLSVPKSYDGSKPQRLMVGFAGTNWLGAQIQPYLGLETTTPQDGEIYVYPDLEWHDFPGWGNLGGWLLGPHAGPAKGNEDIEFTRELVELLGEEYCIDTERIFATGHSWGGDMAAVVGCFLGDIFRAVAPAAANRPYWFDAPSGQVGCVSHAAVWTFFGQNETHFTSQAYPGEYGDEQVSFWKAHHECEEGETTLAAGNGECVEYAGCIHETRYCFYDPSAGHSIPSYFSSAVLDWFRSF